MNGNELDAEDFDEDPTRIIDGQAKGNEMKTKSLKMRQPGVMPLSCFLGNCHIVLYNFHFFCNLFMHSSLTNHKLHNLLNV